MSSLIVCSQTTLTDSLCFSKSESISIMKDLKRLDVCDSITQNQYLQILNFKSIVRVSNDQVSIVSSKLSDTERTLDKTMLKLKVSKKLTTYGIPSAFIGGFLIGYILRK